MLEMITTLVGAIISSITAITVCSLSNRKVIIKMEYKLDELTSEVKEFNNVKLRTYEIEKQLAIDKEQHKKYDEKLEELKNERKIS